MNREHAHQRKKSCWRVSLELVTALEIHSKLTAIHKFVVEILSRDAVTAVEPEALSRAMAFPTISNGRSASM